ncbi:hypothetical protein SNEBB_004384 [Seison nebaliae]|nr:hypothetical protein SNEBB_004384 [Seison nebaliae]
MRFQWKFLFIFIPIVSSIQVNIGKIREYVHPSVKRVDDIYDIFLKMLNRQKKLAEPTLLHPVDTFQLNSFTSFIDRNNIFQLYYETCRLLPSKIVAILGPPNPQLGNSACPIADNFHIPYFQVDSTKVKTNRNYLMTTRTEDSDDFFYSNVNTTTKKAERNVNGGLSISNRIRKKIISENSWMFHPPFYHYRSKEKQREKRKPQRPSSFVISLHPTENQLSMAFTQIIAAFRWTHAIIIVDYEDAMYNGGQRFSGNILNEYSWFDKIRVSVRYVKSTDNYHHYRSILKEIRDERLTATNAQLQHIEQQTPKNQLAGIPGPNSLSDSASVNTNDKNNDEDSKPTLGDSQINIILDMGAKKAEKMLRISLQLGMINEYFHFLLTSLDIDTIDFTDYQFNNCNITGFRLINMKSRSTYDFFKEMNVKLNLPLPSADVSKEIHSVEYYFAYNIEQAKHYETITDKCLMRDSLYLLDKSLNDFSTMNEMNHLLDQSAKGNCCSCENSSFWAEGSIMYSRIMSTSVRDGCSGFVNFTEGTRSNFTLTILELTRNGLKETGQWIAPNKLNMKSDNRFPMYHRMRNRTLLITTIAIDPYIMIKKDGKNLTGNDKYEGFCIDLLEELSEMCGFNYKIRERADGAYGRKVNGSWDGMIGELARKEVDLAVGAVTITYGREQDIDFSKPFMNLGISILFKVPKSEKPGLFSFLAPLSIEIWLYTILAYMFVSVLLWVLARFSPYEWTNPHPCNAPSKYLVNQFNISNSLWFAVGTLMQQGSEINPRALSTRIIGGVWWFFTLIIISSYTANLAAFLTVERFVLPINSAEDLANQDNIEYASLDSGSTLSFFAESKLSVYRKIFKYLTSSKDHTVSSEMDGIRRVLQGNFAFFMESSKIEYQMSKDCNLTQIGGLLDSKSYGIATQEGSPWRDILSNAILQLQESGKLQALYTKWWKTRGTCNREEKKDSRASPLGVENVGGIFVVLLAGLSISIFVAVLEFIWYTVRRRKHNPEIYQSVAKEMKDELKYAVRCHTSTKRPNIKRRCSQCPEMHRHHNWKQEPSDNSDLNFYEFHYHNAPSQTLYLPSVERTAQIPYDKETLKKMIEHRRNINKNFSSPQIRNMRNEKNKRDSLQQSSFLFNSKLNDHWRAKSSEHLYNGNIHRSHQPKKQFVTEIDKLCNEIDIDNKRHESEISFVSSSTYQSYETRKDNEQNKRSNREKDKKKSSYAIINRNATTHIQSTVDRDQSLNKPLLDDNTNNNNDNFPSVTRRHRRNKHSHNSRRTNFISSVDLRRSNSGIIIPLLPRLFNEYTDTDQQLPSYSMEVGKSKCNRHFQFLMEFITVLIAMSILLVLMLALNPSKRGFFCNDLTIRYPYQSDTVTVAILVAAILCLAFLTFLILNLTHSNSRHEMKSRVIQCVLNLSIDCLIFGFGMFLTMAVAEIGKVTVGRLRPHFIDVCKPDVVCPNSDPYKYIEDYKCQGTDAKAIRNGRLSFPSGHSASVYYGMVTLIIYLEFRWNLSLRFLRLFSQAALFAFAFYVGCSRIADHRHHPTDVIAGAALGSIVAIYISICLHYRHYYPDPRYVWKVPGRQFFDFELEKDIYVTRDDLLHRKPAPYTARTYHRPNDSVRNVELTDMNRMSGETVGTTNFHKNNNNTEIKFSEVNFNANLPSNQNYLQPQLKNIHIESPPNYINSN